MHSFEADWKHWAISCMTSSYVGSQRKKSFADKWVMKNTWPGLWWGHWHERSWPGAGILPWFWRNKRGVWIQRFMIEKLDRLNLGINIQTSLALFLSGFCHYETERELCPFSHLHNCWRDSTLLVSVSHKNWPTQTGWIPKTNFKSNDRNLPLPTNHHKHCAWVTQQLFYRAVRKRVEH